MQQDAERRYLDPEPSVEMLCAVVNNNVRCYNESMEFAERVEDTLDDDHKVYCTPLILLCECNTCLGASAWGASRCADCAQTCLLASCATQMAMSP